MPKLEGKNISFSKIIFIRRLNRQNIEIEEEMEDREFDHFPPTMEDNDIPEIVINRKEVDETVEYSSEEEDDPGYLAWKNNLSRSNRRYF